MRFKDFIKEAKNSHRKTLVQHGEMGEPETQRVWSLLKKHCSDALDEFQTPIWRGMTHGVDEVYLIQGDAANIEGRKSRNSTNYYTIIMDHFFPQHGYPMRSKSIICGNNANRRYASTFGSLYAIFPYNGVKIGVCEKFDLWQTTDFTVGGARHARSIDDWNRFYDHGAGVQLDASSYEAFVQSIVDNLGKGNEWLEDVFGSDPTTEGVNKVLKEAYSPSTLHTNLATTADIGIYEDRREVWISGPCIAISYDVWQEMEKEGRRLHFPG